MGVAIYARVSTDKQNIKQQIEALRKFCAEKNLQISREFSDKAVSGSEISRKGLDALIEQGVLGVYNHLVVYDIDRLGRNWELGVILEKFLQDTGITLVSMRDTIDMGTAVGRFNYRVRCVVAAFEREATIEKIKLGVERAKKQGKYKGRKKGSKNKKPVGRPKKK